MDFAIDTLSLSFDSILYVYVCLCVYLCVYVLVCVGGRDRVLTTVLWIDRRDTLTTIIGLYLFKMTYAHHGNILELSQEVVLIDCCTME